MATLDITNPKVRLLMKTDERIIDEDIIHRKLSLTYKFLISLKGQFLIRYNGREELCQPGDLIYMPPRQEYETVFKPGVTEFLNLFFDFQPEQRQMDESGEPINNFFIMLNRDKLDPTKYSKTVYFTDVPAFNKSFVIHSMPDAEIKLREMYQLYNDSQRYSRMRLGARFVDFLLDVVDQFNIQNESPSRLKAKSIVNYINENYNEGLTCRSVAEHFSYHPNYVNRIVRELTGISLHDYIVGIKIQHANRMLLETDMTITDIAYNLAFHDASHFSSVYYAHTGMKPSDRRKRFHETEAMPEL
ncbi:MAG: helix-turn-helix transcriptional regulator [Clostridiales bacterium]|nr:helix-turn-helix transcriptional regulator [Clostridiales bacterium]